MRIFKTLLAGALSVGMITAVPMVASAQPAAQVQVVTPSNCEAYARQYANMRTSGPALRVAGGAAIGAGWGAVIGLFFGRPGLGALIGAGVGAGGGIFVGDANWQYHYNHAYVACSRGAPY